MKIIIVNNILNENNYCYRRGRSGNPQHKTITQALLIINYFMKYL